MRPPSLLVVAGRTVGVRYSLETEETLVGRSSQCQVQLVDEEVSRQHAVFRRRNEEVELEDLGSQNGTWLNAERVQSRTSLHAGDAIRIGAATLIYEPSLELLRGEAADVLLAGEAGTVLAHFVDRAVTGEESSKEQLADVLLEVLSKAIAAPSRSRRSSEIAASALEVVARRFNADRGLLLGIESEGARPRVLATFGEGLVTISRTVVHRVVEGRSALASGDVGSELELERAVSLMRGEIRSLAAAPLIVEGRLVGLLQIDRKDKGAYGAVELEALVPLANLIGLVVLAGEGLRGLEDRVGRDRYQIDRPWFVANSPSFRRVVEELERAASSDSTVLIEGETGTGKEVLARLLHASSPRHQGPFVAINCGALPESLEEAELFGHEEGAFTGATATRLGLLEQAKGGTIFLDEVGECTPATQVKLLRALQERVIHRLGGQRPIELDVRVVAASATPLRELVASGRLREDLYFRLAVVPISVPPLRQRPEDVAPLAQGFAERLALAAGLPPKRFSDDAITRLEGSSWPGNVRELENVVERLVILGEGSTIGAEDLPIELLLGRDVAKKALREGDKLKDVVARVEKEMILRSMVRTGGVKTATAEALGISRVTLDAKLEAYDIEWRKS